MEKKDIASSYQSQCSSLLDLPATFDIHAENSSVSAQQQSSGDIVCYSTPSTLGSVTSSAATAETGSSNQDTERDVSLEGEEYSTSPCRTADAFQPTDNSSIINFSSSDLHKYGKGEASNMRRCLDEFYRDCSQEKPLEPDPTYAWISEQLSSKILELQKRKGNKYILKSFQIALVLLNKYGPRIFPIASHNTGFYLSDDAAVNLEGYRPIAGLSSEVVDFIVKQKLKMK